jgi:hypothetical protein
MPIATPQDGDPGDRLSGGAVCVPGEAPPVIPAVIDDIGREAR